ncbi:peptidoglycan binding domain-containing protein, partial [Promineifilum sp.]|uniref:peptidoglycan binding domain-containing protein n=1 Tax=Promineifilum sp. TaxID=2664178 RepID=UPI0035AF14A4
MQALSPRTQSARPAGARNLGYFLIPPVVGLTLVVVILAVAMSLYRAQHSGRIYTGVTIGGVDLGGLTVEEAQAALAGAAQTGASAVTLVDPGSGQEWDFAPAQLGIQTDVAATAQAAFDVGRSGGPLRRLQDTFQSWYYGRPLAPIVIFDEAQLDRALGETAAAIERNAVSATWQTGESGLPAYTPGQIGRHLDRAYLREQLLQPIRAQSGARVELLVHDVYPPVYDAPQTAERLERILAAPVNFYFQEPLEDLDLSGVTLPVEELTKWIRVEQVQQPDGHIEHLVRVDENAARNWLSQFGAQVYRDPVNARYYFNDDTRELVLVAPHTNGRELDVDATLARFVAQINSDNHAVPLIIKEITPLAHSGATAAELGITELITETTTWFYGSSDARKHNIARAAANFYGVVVAPGEEFSFNRYLGSVSETDGYEV